MIVISSKESVLDAVVRGYRPIEPSIIASLALGRNVFLEALHGVGKTTVGRILGLAMDSSGRGFRHYAGDKAGIIDLGGIPDTSTGQVVYAETERNLKGAVVILVDELPRANKERQNYWLEVLEERRFQGEKLEKLRIVIATGNPETYAANNRMDAALKDRFLFWLPCNNFETVSSDEIKNMIDLNIERYRCPDDQTKVLAERIADIITEMQMKMDEYLADQDRVDQIKEFVASFVQFVKDKISQDSSLREEKEAYISAREFSNNMFFGILSLSAYFDVMGYRNTLQNAGEHAIKYGLETKHAGAGPKFLDICNSAWRQLRNMLMDGVNTPAGRLQWAFASSITAAQKVDFWRSNRDQVIDLLEPSDMANMASSTLEQINKEDLGQIGPFFQTMNGHKATRHIAGEVKGAVLTELHRKMVLATMDGASPKLREVAGRYRDAHRLTPVAVSEILGS